MVTIKRVRCPNCNSGQTYPRKKAGDYRCAGCGLEWTPDAEPETKAEAAK